MVASAGMSGTCGGAAACCRVGGVCGVKELRDSRVWAAGQGNFAALLSCARRAAYGRFLVKKLDLHGGGGVKSSRSLISDRFLGSKLSAINVCLLEELDMRESLNGGERASDSGNLEAPQGFQDTRLVAELTALVNCRQPEALEVIKSLLGRFSQDAHRSLAAQAGDPSECVGNQFALRRTLVERAVGVILGQHKSSSFDSEIGVLWGDLKNDAERYLLLSGMLHAKYMPRPVLKSCLEQLYRLARKLTQRTEADYVIQAYCGVIAEFLPPTQRNVASLLCVASINGMPAVGKELIHQVALEVAAKNRDRLDQLVSDIINDPDPNRFGPHILTLALGTVEVLSGGCRKLLLRRVRRLPDSSGTGDVDADTLYRAEKERFIKTTVNLDSVPKNHDQP